MKVAIYHFLKTHLPKGEFPRSFNQDHPVWFWLYRHTTRKHWLQSFLWDYIAYLLYK